YKNLKHGYGKYTSKNGERYNGRWFLNRRHGRFIITGNNQNSSSAYWFLGFGPFQSSG
ncbi:MAG: hypothetical protein ACNA7Z_06025, partial [Dethiobacteria bacterium]